MYQSLQEVLRGGLDKIKEAGTLLLGGHSVEDDEFKYGFSGTGIINTAIKGNIATAAVVGEFTGDSKGSVSI